MQTKVTWRAVTQEKVKVTSYDFFPLFTSSQKHCVFHFHSIWSPSVFCGFSSWVSSWAETLASVNTGFGSYRLGEGCLLLDAYCKALYTHAHTVSSMTSLCECVCAAQWCRRTYCFHASSMYSTVFLFVSSFLSFSNIFTNPNKCVQNHILVHYCVV